MKMYSLPHQSFFEKTNSKSLSASQKWAHASYYRASSSLPFRVEMLMLEVFFTTLLVPKSTDENDRNPCPGSGYH